MNSSSTVPALRITGYVAKALERPARMACVGKRSGAHESIAQGNPAQSSAMAAGVRAGAVRRAKHQAGSAHAALRTVCPRHRSARRAAQPRHGICGGQDRRHRWRPAQRHARKPDRTRHRADRAARRAIYACEGIDRRGDRHQHVVHARHVISARRAKAPCAGIRQGQRPAAGQPAFPGDDRDPDSLGGLRSRFCGRIGVHGEVEPRPVCPAHRGLWPGPAVLAQDPS